MTALVPADLAYMAALIDNLAVLKTRLVNGSDLPAIVLTTTRSPEAVRFLARCSGSQVTTLVREYNKKGCIAHCKQPHLHIDTTGHRWQVTGAKATIVLHNLLPYMRVQKDLARKLIEAGRTIGYKGQVVNRMRELGWDIPELKPQPRARVPISSSSRSAPGVTSTGGTSRTSPATTRSAGSAGTSGAPSGTST